MYFFSDEEFTDFCVAPFAVSIRLDKDTWSYKGDYSDAYKKCVKEGKTFVIKDIHSQVYKRQCVTKRVPIFHEGKSTKRDAPVQLKVQGLRKYYGEKMEEKIRTKKNEEESGNN